MRKSKLLNLTVDNTRREVITPTSPNFLGVQKKAISTNEELLKNCIEIISIISNHFKKKKEEEIVVSKTDICIPQLKAEIPNRLCQSLMLVLKSYVTVKIEQKQVQFKKMKVPFTKKSTNTSALKKRNLIEKAYMSLQSQTENIFVDKHFQEKTKLKKNQSRIKQLQLELQLYREMVTDKNQIIKKMNQNLNNQRQKYHQSIELAVRNKNIEYIQDLFTKQYGKKTAQNRNNICTAKGKRSALLCKNLSPSINTTPKSNLLEPFFITKTSSTQHQKEYQQERHLQSKGISFNGGNINELKDKLFKTDHEEKPTKTLKSTQINLMKNIEELQVQKSIIMQKMSEEGQNQSLEEEYLKVQNQLLNKRQQLSILTKKYNKQNLLNQQAP